MPGQRAPGQKLINVPMTERFIEEIDAALPKAGYSDRSKFIRDAVFEKLDRLGFKPRADIALAPGRSGKGGYPTHKTAKILNNRGLPVSSKVASVAQAASDAAIAEARRLAAKSQHSPQVDAPSVGKPSLKRGDPSRSNKKPVIPK